MVRYRDSEWLIEAPDDVVAAIDVAYRRRLTKGETVFLSATGAAVSGRTYATVVIPPDAFVTFSYTNYDGQAVTPLAAIVESELDRHGGIVLDENDQVIETPPG